MKGKQKPAYIHTPVRIKFSPSAGVPPTGVPRRCCNAGYSAQHHGQDQYNHSHKNPSRENHVFVPKQKGATAAVDARKNPGHTSECSGRNTPFHSKCSRSDGNLARKQYYFTFVPFSRAFLLTLPKSFLSDILCSNRGLSVTRLGDWSPMAVKNASPFFLI